MEQQNLVDQPSRTEVARFLVGSGSSATFLSRHGINL
jgi:hypothetical protein